MEQNEQKGEKLNRLQMKHLTRLNSNILAKKNGPNHLTIVFCFVKDLLKLYKQKEITHLKHKRFNLF